MSEPFRVTNPIRVGKCIRCGTEFTYKYTKKTNYCSDACRGESINKQKWVEGKKVGVKLILYACICGEYVKLGSTVDLLKRALGIRTHNPYPMTVFKLQDIPDRFAEVAVHEKWASFRHRGEWFRLEGELRDYILARQIDAKDVVRLE